MSGYERHQSQQAIYQQALKKVKQHEYANNRKEIKNRLAQQSIAGSDESAKSQARLQLNLENLADRAKQVHGDAIPYDLDSADILNGIKKEMQSKGVDDRLLKNYLEKGDKELFYKLGREKGPNPQGGIRGIVNSFASENGVLEFVNPIGKLTEAIDTMVQKIPSLTEEQWDSFAREKL